MRQEVRTEITGGAKGRRFWLMFVASGLWLSGAIWLVFEYFIQRQTDLGPRPWPIQHWWLVLHGAFGFAALWFMGLMWGTHVVRLWRTKRHRVSGSTLLGSLLILAVTGYLLYYYTGEDAIRERIASTHWALGLTALLPFLIHWSRRKRR